MNKWEIHESYLSVYYAVSIFCSTNHVQRKGECGGFFLSLALFNRKTMIVPARITMMDMMMNFSIEQY